MTSTNQILAPRVAFDERLSRDNIFAEVFGGLTSDQWRDTLIRSIVEPKIDGVEFPSFPSEELQNRIHGHSAAHSLREAASFYDFIRAQNLTGPGAPWHGKGRLLDFGAGWGRILRLFLRDFPLRNIVGFEPNGIFCSVARANNPFVSFVGGEFMPPTMLSGGQINLIVGWSVFSHLSEMSATAWLAEFSRLLAPGGAAVLTTRGIRFLERLRSEAEQLRAGQEIHWYSRVCLDAVGNIEDRITEYSNGKFVWFALDASKLYGEAFLGQDALTALIAERNLPLELELFDSTSLAQDVFVLRRL